MIRFPADVKVVPPSVSVEMPLHPWRRFECTPDPAGCLVAFEDPEFATSARDAVYYVRALQAPTPAINAANLRTEFDTNGNAVRVNPCYAGWRGSPGDDWLAPAQERAWSSPIYVDLARSERRAAERPAPRTRACSTFFRNSSMIGIRSSQGDASARASSSSLAGPAQPAGIWL